MEYCSKGDLRKLIKNMNDSGLEVSPKVWIYLINEYII
jgi:hypothetical protein